MHQRVGKPAPSHASRVHDRIPLRARTASGATCGPLARLVAARVGGRDQSGLYSKRFNPLVRPSLEMISKAVLYMFRFPHSSALQLFALFSTARILGLRSIQGHLSGDRVLLEK